MPCLSSRLPTGLPSGGGLLLAVLVLLGAAPAAPAAAQIVVTTATDERNTNSQCSLREAILNANNDNQSGSTDCATGSGATTITFSAALNGTPIQLTRTGFKEDAGDTGDLDVAGSITITGNGTANTIVDGNDTDRVFHILSGTVVLQDLTIRNGDNVRLGGGVYNEGTLTLVDSRVTSNHAVHDAVAFSDPMRGGGVYNTGMLTVTRTEISDNTMTNSVTAQSFGGGLANTGTVMMDRSVVSGNQTGQNNFGQQGGGIHNEGTLTITRSEISGNTAGAPGSLSDGGGIHHVAGTLTLRNTTISENTARQHGGGLSINAGATLNNCTITQNTATTDAGGLHLGGGSSTIANTIIAENTAGGNDPDVLNSNFTSGGYNLLGVDGPNTSGWNGPGDQTGTTGTPLDPQLDALGGTAPRFHALQAASPALNAGDPGTGCETTDQRGVARPVHARCDTGAYEYDAALSASYEVTITGDEGWRMLSFPITGGNLAELAEDTDIQGVPGGAHTGHDPNARYYPSTGSWTVPVSLGAPFGDGHGFILYFFDDTQNGIGTLLPITLDAVGSEPTADVDVPLNTGDFTLLGNPFGTRFALDELTANGSLVQTISVWDDGATADVAGGASNGSFVTYNFGAGQGHVVAPWQGFFVESTTATEATLPTSGKTSTASTVAHFSKRGEAVDAAIPLELHGPEGNLDRAATLYFHETAREGRDAYDATKLDPLLTHYATLAFVQDRDGLPHLLSQDARPLAMAGTQTYDVAFQNVGLSGDFEVRWPDWKGIPSDWRLTFVDRDLGRSVDMRLEDGYVFEAERDVSAGKHAGLFAARAAVQVYDGPARFAVVIASGAATAVEGERPASFGLEGNYPNPFNPSTVIRYALSETGPVRLAVYDVLGREVAVLVDGVRAAGRHEVAFDASRLAGGVYVYRLTAGRRSEARTMVLVE